MGNLGADTASLPGCVARQSGFSVSRTSSVGTPGVDCGGMGGFRTWPTRAILHTHDGGKETTAAGNRDVGQVRGRDRSGSGYGLIRVGNTSLFGLGRVFMT